MPLYDYEKFFPFKSIREQQKRAIEFAIDAYESGKKVVLLEIGTMPVPKSITTDTYSL